MAKVSSTTTLTIPPKGEAAVSYWLLPSATNVSRVYKADGSRTCTPSTLTVQVMKREGGGEATVVTDFASEGLTMFSRSGTEQALNNSILYTRYAEYDGGSYTVPQDSTLRVIEFKLQQDGTPIDLCRIPVVDDGAPGAAGKRGAVLRGPQAWSDCADGYSFEAGGENETWQDVVLYDGSFYSCVRSHVKNANNYPLSAADNLNHYWQLGEEINLVIANIILAKYILVKNLGVETIDMRDADGNILFQAKGGSVTCRTGMFENISVLSGRIAGFNINGNGLTNEPFDNDAFIRFCNTEKDALAEIGANVLPGVAGGLRVLAQFQNHDTTGLPTDPNYCMLLSARGTRDNRALQLDGGSMCGVAMRNRIVQESLTLTRYDYNVISIGAADVTLTLPSMGLYDDGHVIRIKRMGAGALKLVTSSCYTYNGTAGRYSRPCIIYDGNAVLTGSNALSLNSIGDAMELVWCRDLVQTVGSTTYYGAWIQYKLPIAW